MKKVFLSFFVFIFFILILGGGGASSSDSNDSEGDIDFPSAVLKWKEKVQQECEKNGIPESVNYILGIITVESGGNAEKTPDIMQCSESQGRPPNSIKNPNESIEVGVKYFANMYKSHKGIDLMNVVQAYNYGGGFLENSSKEYSLEKAIEFARVKSNNVQAMYTNPVALALGFNYRWNYGNMFYAQLVKQYLHSSNNGGNSKIVEIAKKELSEGSHDGGQKYWQWYGFSSRVEWCAIFVSYCADKSSLKMDKFAYCPTGIATFKTKNQWLDKGKEPKSGNIIFFDWNNDGTSDHVGIVKEVKNNIVFTIEGNSGDKISEQKYPINSAYIAGYGTP